MCMQVKLLSSVNKEMFIGISNTEQHHLAPGDIKTNKF